jgi:hypothetical protein
MSLLWGTLAVLLLIIVVATIIDIVRRHLGGGPTAGWILLVIVLPFIGAAVYWARRKPEAGEAERIAAGEAARREQARRQPFDSTGMGL